MYGFFHEGGAPSTQLAELLESATREVADNTQKLVGIVNELMGEAAATGTEVSTLIKQQSALQDKVTRDPLTGVLNREGFAAEAEEVLAKAARYGVAIGVGYLDIDRFKAVNDKLGHALGDLALTMVASEISEAVGQNDLVGRMGGDEFVILLNDCTEPDARQTVERIISNVASKTVRKQNQSCQVAVSAGLLYVRPSNQTQQLDTVVHAADQLMYQAKRAGGSQAKIRAIHA
jgi:diguanylate cyclase (GGDEF)-like protein